MSSPSPRYRLSVCPHDTAKNIAAWFLINTYLQKRLGLSMRFEPSDNFHAEREQVLAGYGIARVRAVLDAAWARLAAK